MNHEKHLLAAATLFLLAACGGAADEVHDVQWYLDHPAEHEAQMVKCKNDPAKLKDTPACINAAEAVQRQVNDTELLSQPYKSRH
ncbi:EexN family lipoprotein [Neisseria bacilliformis]|uniref:EexN family lipoprotein n=1 Tax=Neisseria bacilliformis TaxID=267212 RepID=UPI0028E9E059|nr:EexN family lipoprotein [Neisseria bacilliformis]